MCLDQTKAQDGLNTDWDKNRPRKGWKKLNQNYVKEGLSLNPHADKDWLSLNPDEDKDELSLNPDEDKDGLSFKTSWR